jgi:hemerythrin-like domain-containing protein
VGWEFPLLQSSRAAHRELRQAATRIQSGSFDEEAVEAFVKALRAHLEREIHDVFALAEDMIAAETLEAMSNWDVDHIYEVYAKRRPWAEKGLG